MSQKELGEGDNVEQYTLDSFQYADIEQEVWEEIQKVQLRVLGIIEESEEARNSYAVLVQKYWEKELKHKGIDRTPFMLSDTEKMNYLKSPESITRAYRKLQELDGIQFADDETQEERDRREEGFEKSMAKREGLDDDTIWKG
jgi:hypothetical protein